MRSLKKSGVGRNIEKEGLGRTINKKRGGWDH